MKFASLLIAWVAASAPFAGSAAAAEAQAAPGPTDSPPGVAGLFASAEKVSDALLDRQRGGFLIHGMTVNLGADIRTYINGALMLGTTVNWTNAGIVKQQFVGAGLSPAESSSLNASALANGQISMAVGGTPAFSANEGQTMLIHRVENGLQNILINSASNQTITQHVDATLELGGYAAFHDSVMSARVADSLDAAIGASTIGMAAGR